MTAPDALYADECVRVAGRSSGPHRSGRRLDGCDSDQILHGVGELPVEGDQGVGPELGQGDVLGVERVGPPELVGDPCEVLKDAVCEQPDPQPAHVAEPSPGILLSYLAAV